MTASAPIERTSSSWVVLATPVTWAPNALASCTANHPTAPAAPMTKTFGPAEHLLTRLEPGHGATDGFHGPGEVHAQHGDLGPAQPKARDHDADQVGQAGHDVPVPPMEAGRMHLNQDLVAGGHWLVDLP